MRCSQRENNSKPKQVSIQDTLHDVVLSIYAPIFTNGADGAVQTLNPSYLIHNSVWKM